MWVPTTKGRAVTPQQILRTGLSRGSHTSPVPRAGRAPKSQLKLWQNIQHFLLAKD